MNAKQEDVGVLLRYELDLSFGSNENNFECTVNRANHCCEAGYYLYMDGTEYGGLIDAVRSNTATGDVTYSGRTWHGLLESKILAPDAGQDYLVVSGEANTVLASLIQRVGLGSLFAASTAASGVTIKSYQMDRYIGAYSGIRKMLKEANAKLCCTFAGGKVVLSAAPVMDYTDGLDADIIDFSAKRVKGKVNHLICLGQGELSERTVVHLYADADGNISQTQTISGVDEYAAVYDYPSAESAETLIEEGTKRLKELRAQDALSVAFTQTDNLYDVGDIVGAYDGATDVSVSVEITQKIVTVKGGLLTVSYSTDKTSTTVSVGTGSSGESEQPNVIAKLAKMAKDSEMLGGKAPAYYLQPRNLLDNSDFTNPVNQRESASSKDSWQYIADRWLCKGAGFALNSSGITIPASGHLAQRVPVGIVNSAAKLTAVYQKTDGSIATATITKATNSYYEYHIYNNTSAAVKVRWAALYEGEYTAENLPPYVPKGYGVELAECLRYFERVHDHIYFSAAGGIHYAIRYTPKRTWPTVTLGGTSNVSGMSVVFQAWNSTNDHAGGQIGTATGAGYWYGYFDVAADL